MPQKILKQRVRTSFSKSLYSYNYHAEVQARMAEELVENLRSLNTRRFNTVLEVGCGTGLLTQRFLKTFPITTFYANDLVHDCEAVLNDIFRQYPQGNFAFLGGDIEELATLPGNLDLLVSNATFQWLADLGEFLTRIKTHLKKDGMLAFSTFGPHNLHEIRELTGNSLKYLAYENIQALLEKHFQILFCSEEEMKLNFSSPCQVLRHLRLTGVNGVSKQQWTKSDLKAFERQYCERFGEHDGVRLTYHPILCIVKNQ